MIVVVGGVSGTGKSTIGQKLAKQLNMPFFDADDFHPESNINKMKKGVALTDEDRRPWLEELAQLIAEQDQKSGMVLACSALKEAYRQLLSSRLEGEIHWITLTGSFQLLKTRLSNRKNHFFDESLLTSQLSTLEEPSYGLNIDVDDAIEVIVKQASEYLTISNT